MAIESLRAVVVGCRVGRNHAEAYVHSAETELVALCDIDATTLNRVADQHDVEGRYDDYEAMLDEVRPDIVSVATPQPLHAEMTMLAATKYTPKAILCEKGMANNMGEARAMLRACDANGVKLIVGHEGRQFGIIERARELIAEGAIGEPLLHHVWYGQGGMMNQMCHGCDRAMYIMSDPEPAWVIANVQRESDRWERGWPAEELAAGLVGFPNGMRLILEGETPPGGAGGEPPSHDHRDRRPARGADRGRGQGSRGHVGRHARPQAAARVRRWLGDLPVPRRDVPGLPPPRDPRPGALG